ncbi:MAG: hypothetical protein ABI193_16650 [Minicystis sp.]
MSNARPRLAEIVGQGAPCELSLRMTARGPALSLRGRSLTIRAAGALALEAETLAITARGSASIRVGGALVEEVSGAVTCAVGEPRSVSASAIGLEANDDVELRGREIQLAKEARDQERDS